MKRLTGLDRLRWATDAGPGGGRLVVDVDSFVGEVHGHAKQSAGFGYAHVRGYHPILATRAETGEVLHIRARKGSPAARTRDGRSPSMRSGLRAGGGRVT